MSDSRALLFLYTRLPDYFYQCLLHFVSNYGYKVILVRYHQDTDTRYSFSDNPRLQLFYKDEADLDEIIAAERPEAIYLSGWSDAHYRRVAKKHVSRIPVILGLDNPWLNTFKQKALTAIAPVTIRSFCNTAWVAGPAQYEYASRLGFSSKQIYPELYCADTDKFLQTDLNHTARGGERTIAYVGRMVKYKKPDVLARLFHVVNQTLANPWNLILAGEGPLKESIRIQNYANVHVIDFIDPGDLAAFYERVHVFCLPSENEHWGVAVHEAVAAGLPVLLSNSVQAGRFFLIDGFNGYAFDDRSDDSFEAALRNVMTLPDDELRRMGDNSRLLSERIQHKTWSATLLAMVTQHRFK